MLFELVKLVQPDYIKPAGGTFNTYTTNYKKCADNTPDDLKFENETVVTAFLVRLEKEYVAELNKATAFANRFIDISTTTQVLLVKRLIELIRDDKSIPDTIQFAVYKDSSFVDKSGLVAVSEVYLPAFLLSVWKFEEYFAELCFRSYNDEKYELTAEEFAGYYNVLKARITANDKKSTASDFLEDLCANLCLLVCYSL